MTPQTLRTLVPAAKSFTYLNAAASSPLSQPVADALRRAVDQQVESGDLYFQEWLATRERARERLARFLGTTPDSVAFLPSTSMGMNVVASDWRRRGIRSVLTLEGEFPSTTVPFLHHGLTVHAVKRRADGGLTVEDLDAACPPGVGAVVVSVVQFGSGLWLDVPALDAWCRGRGLPLALNVSQAVGQVPLDLSPLAVEYVCGASHKWLMAGGGGAFVRVRPGVLSPDALPWAGWLSVPEEDLFRTFPSPSVEDAGRTSKVTGLRRRNDAAALEAGGALLSPFAALEAALGLLDGVGIGAIAAHNRALQTRLREGLRRRGFLPNAPDGQAAGICVVPVQGAPEAVVRALFARGIATTPRAGGLRLSTHVFNAEEDVEVLLAAVDALGIRPG